MHFFATVLRAPHSLSFCVRAAPPAPCPIFPSRAALRARGATGSTNTSACTAAGSALIGAPTFAWRSAGKVRAFVRLAAMQAEVFVDPVAPRARRAAREGKIGQGAGGAARTQKLRL